MYVWWPLNKPKWWRQLPSKKLRFNAFGIFFVWGVVKEKCYTDKPQPIGNLKANIRNVIAEVWSSTSKIGPLEWGTVGHIIVMNFCVGWGIYLRTFGQAKLVHLGHRKPARIPWKADTPKTSHCLVWILVQRHNWAIFLRKWARRSRYSQLWSLLGHVERIFVHKNFRGGYW